ncbi:hypothetical protein AALP_AA3G230900, partial [Arabis alpina]
MRNRKTEGTTGIPDNTAAVMEDSMEKDPGTIVIGIHTQDKISEEGLSLGVQAVGPPQSHGASNTNGNDVVMVAVSEKKVRKALFQEDSAEVHVSEKSGSGNTSGRDEEGEQGEILDTTMEENNSGDDTIAGIEAADLEINLGMTIGLENVASKGNDTMVTLEETQVNILVDQVGLGGDGPNLVMGPMILAGEDGDKEELDAEEDEVDETIGEPHNKLTKPEKKKLVKGNPLLKGISSKKRLVQALVSPRKKNGSKKEVQIGDDLYP